MSSLSSQNRDPSLLCLLRSRSRSTRLRSSDYVGIRTSSMDQAELSTEQVLQRDIPWETYMTTKLISATDLQLLRRYDKKTESARAQLLDEDGRAYVQLFVTILRDIFKEETVEYVLALIYEMLSANPARARLFHDQSLAHEDTYEPLLRLLSKGNWFIQEKSCKIFAWIISYRPKAGVIANGEASGSKKHITTIDDLLSGLVEWLCAQLRQPSHPTRGAPVAISCLSTLLKELVVRSSFVQADGVKLLVPLISPTSTQQFIQLLYETCLCIWLLSYYEPGIEYLATSRTMQRLTEVVKSSTKEKVVRVVILTFRNLLPKGTFGAQMVDLGLPHIIHSLKTQAWSDEDLLDALIQLEEGLKDKIRKLSSFDKYKQEVLLGHLDWNPMHKEANFWRENVTSFEENDFQILRVLLTILDTSSDPRSLAVACYDLSQFIQYHAAGRVIVTDLKAKERVMKLMAHENVEVTKNALLCIQRLLLGAKYASFLQV
ncbi:PREDICTED: V-type proton ATPase subunit H-like isoform X2 [Brassica oleracea var. oleracea]|uniref:V-type proton ATPase subunit H-like isoform X2 n=1 Tax=Brassica oleracea var. oleracea TaxID=109376 RepID=UPI0006A6F59E|nr:PREDICTED: V-type proton ATPase subunit H-like isoform X2 [Brassica oleracea var. oleracea]